MSGIRTGTDRRNVFRAGTACITVAWLIIQVAETIFLLFAIGDEPARCDLPLLLTMNSQLTDSYLTLVVIVQ